MNKPVRVSDTPYGIEVEAEKVYFGVLVGKVPSNHFVMDHTKELSLRLLDIKQQHRKRFISVVVK